MMNDNSAGQPKEPVNIAGVVGGPLYANPQEALKAVRDDFHYWSAKLTDSSFTLSAAVIGANWAVFNSVDKILGNPWAKWSVAVVIFSLGINLLGVKVMSERLRAQMEHAEEDPKRWSDEFFETLGKNDPWPYTVDVIQLSRVLRECRTWFPVLGGLLFLTALITG